jgi:hypothetical protein
MTRFQNNQMPAAGRPMPLDQGGWAGEISNNIPTAQAAPMQTMMPPATPGPLPMGQQQMGMTGNAGPGVTLDMRNRLPTEVIEAPISVEEVRLGSLKAMLAKNVGNYIVASFLVGTQNMVSWEGILYDVGNDYLTIYQASRDRYIVTDYYSLKFIEFFDVERRERCNAILQEEEWASTGN